MRGLPKVAVGDKLVSVIVPIYNVEKYLHKCIESIINQTYRNLEIILIDDGSTDNSSKICDEYVKKDSRVSVVHNKNNGVSKARAIGIEKAQGLYVMLVDGDDWIDYETIGKCVEVAEREQSDCVLFSYVKEYNNKSILNPLFEQEFQLNEREVKEKIHRRLIGFRREELRHPEKIDNLSSVCMKLYRIEIARKGRIIDKREVGTSEDTIFNVYALEHCKSISYVNRCFYHYRKNNDQATTVQYKAELYNQWKRLYQIFQEYFEQIENAEYYNEFFLNRVACGMIGLGLNEVSASHSILKKTKNINKILNDPIYKKAFQRLDISYCPLKWKVFFCLCKNKCSILLVLLLMVVNRLRTRNN